MQHVTDASNKESLEMYLKDSNPLLNNWGRLYRETEKLLEQEEMPYQKLYIGRHLPNLNTSSIPSDELLIEDQGTAALLHYLQMDLLTMQGKKDALEVIVKDDSLQIHKCLNKQREVEVLYEIIINLLTENDQKIAIEPKDIIIMAPDITEYEPYLKGIFKRSASVIEPLFIDIKVSQSNSLIQGLHQLLSLPLSRWSVTELLRLFNVPYFMKKCALSSEDLLIIKQWIRETNIYWGLNKSHKQERLKNLSYLHSNESSDYCWRRPR